MAREPVFRLLLKMGLPMMVSMLINSLFNIVDSIYIASLGTDALTAISLIFPMQNLIVAAGVGVGVGTNAMIAQNLGAKDQKRANLAAGNGLLYTIVLCAVFLLTGLFGIGAYVRAFTKNERVFTYAFRYGTIVMSLASGNILAIYMEKVFQAAGRMMETMTCLIIGAVLNIILDPVLIFGWWGFPRLGITGAAVATVFSQFVCFFSYFFFKKRKPLPVRFGIRYLKPEGRMGKEILGIALPAGMTCALPSVTCSLLNGMLVAYSEVYVAVLGIYYKIQTFFYLPASGLVQGMRPVVSFNYGAREYGRVKKTVRYALYLIAGIMAAGTVLMELVPGFVLMLFQADEALSSAGIPALRIIAVGFVPSALGLICCGCCEALGKGMDSLVVSFSRQFLFIVLFSLVFRGWWGVSGIWASYPAGETVSALISFLILRRIFRKDLS